MTINPMLLQPIIQPAELTTLLISRQIQAKEDAIKKEGLDREITALRQLILTAADATPAINAMSSTISALETEIRVINTELIDLKAKVLLVFDQIYIDFVVIKTGNLTTFELKLNRPALVKQIQLSANTDFDLRKLTGAKSADFMAGTNKAQAEYYINNTIKQWNEKKADKTQALLDQQPDPVESVKERDKLISANLKAIADGDAAEIEKAKNKEVTDAVDIVVEDEGTVVNGKVVDPQNLKGILTKVKDNITIAGPTPQAGNVSSGFTTFNEQQYQPSDTLEKITGGIITPYVDTIPFRISAGATQLIGDDLIDPRYIEIIVPIYFEQPEPSYIRVFNIDGRGSSSNAIHPAKNDIKPASIDELLTPVSSARNVAFNQFSVTSITESYPHKYQIDDSFTDGFNIFAFGAKPRVWVMQGVLINDLIHQWKRKFTEAYNNHLNISVLAKLGNYVQLVVPGAMILIDCYPVDLMINTSTAQETLVPFSMPFIVRRAKPYVNITVSDSMSRMVQMVSKLSDRNPVPVK